MLHYKNHKMYKGGVVFEIPENSYLLEDEKEFEDVFEILSPCKKTSLALSFESENSPKSFFETKDFAENYKLIKDVANVKNNDLIGVYAIYCSDEERFCEYRFEIPEKSERKNILVVLIKSEESTIAENADFVAEFMNSLKRDAF